MRRLARLGPIALLLVLCPGLWSAGASVVQGQEPPAPPPRTPAPGAFEPPAESLSPGERRRTLSEVLVIGGQRQPRWSGAPISLSLKEADLQEVLRSFARLADVNLVLDPGVRGKVTVELDNVPWDQALWVILKTHRLGAELEGPRWLVVPAR